MEGLNLRKSWMGGLGAVISLAQNLGESILGPLPRTRRVQRRAYYIPSGNKHKTTISDSTGKRVRMIDTLREVHQDTSRYPGAKLRELRAERGVGRPPQ